MSRLRNCRLALALACLVAVSPAQLLANEGGDGFSNTLPAPVRPSKPVVKQTPPKVAPTRPNKVRAAVAKPTRSAPARAAVARTRPRMAQPATVAERAPSGQPPAGEERFVAGEVIVRYRLASRQADRDALVRRLGLGHLEGRTFALAGVTVHRYAIASGAPVRGVIAALEASPTVVSAQPNYRYALEQAATKAAGPAQYALERLSIVPAHALTRGAGVTIAVIDSRIDAAHPDLSAARIETIDLIEPGSPDAHGTSVAGVIAASGALSGIAPEAGLLGIAAFALDRSSGTIASSSWLVADALGRAAALGARIVNMSFAGPRDPLVGDSIQGASKRGMVLVAAAGNAGPDTPPLYPAAYQNVVAVTAVDARDAIYAQANSGGHVALAAPGVDVMSLAPGGSYDVSSGTSLAAAHVSGVAALLVSRDPAIEPGRLAAALAGSATDLGAPGVDPVFGAGLPDAARALAATGAVAAVD